MIKYNDHEIREKIKEIPIWHFPFRFGSIIVNAEEPQEYIDWKSSVIPEDLTGKTVLDVGAHEGYFSILAEQRGAKKVVSVDDQKYHSLDVKKRLALVRDIYDSKLEYKTLSVYDLDSLEGVFDVVIFFDVYYHLENPILAFRKIFSKVKDVLLFCGYIIEDRFVQVDKEKSIMYMFEPFELNSIDPTNVWGATTSCLIRMLKLVGFKKVDIVSTFPSQGPSRVLLKAFK